MKYRVQIQSVQIDGLSKSCDKSKQKKKNKQNKKLIQKVRIKINDNERMQIRNSEIRGEFVNKQEIPIQNDTFYQPVEIQHIFCCFASDENGSYKFVTHNFKY